MRKGRFRPYTVIAFRACNARPALPPEKAAYALILNIPRPRAGIGKTAKLGIAGDIGPTIKTAAGGLCAMPQVEIRVTRTAAYVHYYCFRRDI